MRSILRPFLLFALAFALAPNSSAPVRATWYFFPQNYESSRARFRNHVVNLQAQYPNLQTREFTVPSKEDKDLTVDYFYIPAQQTPKKLLVLVSGVHGPEAYAGSAIQHLFLTEYIDAVNFADTGLVMIHAMNPYGFKHHRRVTEQNVNLNRNFDISESLFKTENPGYLKLAHILEPQGRVVIPTIEALALVKDIGQLIATFAVSTRELTVGIGMGQYKNKRGIEYGGEQFEPQVLFAKEILEPILQRYDQIVALDLHTGLGEANQLHLMMGRLVVQETEQAKRNRDAVYRIFGSETNQMYKLTDPGKDEGFYPTYGDFIDFAQMLARKDATVVSLTAEFGTTGDSQYSQMVTLRRLVQENQGHHHGYKFEFAKKYVEKEFLDQFYPQDDVWQDSVITKSRFMFEQVVDNFLR